MNSCCASALFVAPIKGLRADGCGQSDFGDWGNPNLGRKYARLKKSRGAPAGNSNAENQIGQIVPFVSTAEAIAAEHGVTDKTVKRAEKFASTFTAPRGLLPGRRAPVFQFSQTIGTARADHSTTS